MNLKALKMQTIELESLISLFEINEIKSLVQFFAKEVFDVGMSRYANGSQNHPRKGPKNYSVTEVRKGASTTVVLRRKKTELLIRYLLPPSTVLLMKSSKISRLTCLYGALLSLPTPLESSEAYLIGFHLDFGL